ncbi:MAG: hypothetical protein JWO67_750 [Streptosporangiaceae bacterium]|nr:hypothetical protein [Streptosporangiaceae bacterium]
MAYTYPAPAPTLSGDVETISRFLNSPTLIARRLRTLAEQRYIADTLLTGRFSVEGGAVLYETGETIFTADSPRAVAPGGEYPMTTAPTGVASIAKTVKWGQDTEITDESIKRQRMQPVNKAMIKLVNQNVKFIDSVALSAIASAVTATAAAAATWSTATAKQILTDVATARASILALNQGYDPDTVVLDDTTWAYAFAAFTSGGFLPRETDGQNPLITGSFPVIDGMRFLATPNLPTAGTVLVVDSSMLGGMADEDLGGPGYTNAGGIGVQAKTIRDDDEDVWRLRMRRVTVPIVVEPAAGRKITSV